MLLFLEYPKCSTCRRARQWLEEHHIAFEARHIVEENPTQQELADWLERSGLPLKRFFNTSGRLYQGMGLKEKLPSMPQEEQLALLAADGMLVRRPVLVGDDFVLVGFREAEWAARLLR